MPSKYYYLAHAGKKGMKWGYNDGKKNGKRTAEGELTDEEMIRILGLDKYAEYKDASNKADEAYDKYDKASLESAEKIAKKYDAGTLTFDYIDKQDKKVDAYHEKFWTAIEKSNKAYDNYSKSPLSQLGRIVNKGTKLINDMSVDVKAAPVSKWAKIKKWFSWG